MQQFSGTTTDGLVQVADINGGGDGLTYFGSVRNTGANSLTLSIVVTDYFGASDTLAPAIAAAGFQKFDTVSFSFGSNTHPPFQRITVSIRSTTAGQATTYQLFAAEF
jgi:hypothetical protein